jgi:hypothetical protein
MMKGTNYLVSIDRRIIAAGNRNLPEFIYSYTEWKAGVQTLSPPRIVVRLTNANLFNY